MRGFARYLDVLRAPGALAPALFALLGRLPYGMTTLSLLLLGRQQLGSYRAAGLLVAVNALSMAAAGPLLGRRVDRWGPRPVLLVTAAAYPVAAAALTAALQADAPLALDIVLAALLGAALPPLSACMRTLWSQLLTDPDRRQAAFSLEAVVVELTFINGPLVTGLAVALASPAVSLLLAGLGGGAGSLGFALTAPSRCSSDHAGVHRPGRAIAIRGLQVVVFTYLAQVAAFSLFEVAVPATAQRAGAPAMAGVLLAVWAAGSLLGGLVWGTRPVPAAPARAFAGLLLLMGALLAPVSFTSDPVLLVPLMILAGLTIAPASTVGSELTARITPERVRTEAYTWLGTAAGLGAATGALLGGALVDGAGPRAAILCASAVVVLAGVVAAAGHDPLTRAPAGGAAQDEPLPAQDRVEPGPTGPAPLVVPVVRDHEQAR